jgi:hypothetical protein
LHDRIAATTIQTLRNGGQQQAHILSDEGALEKGGGILVGGVSLSLVDGHLHAQFLFL